MRFSSLVLGSVFTFSLLGCGSTVNIDGEDGGGGAGGAPGTATTLPAAAPRRALAMSESAFFALNASTSVSGSATVGASGGIDATATTGPGGPSVDYLYVFIDKSAAAVSSCADPFAAAEVCDRDRDIAVVRIQPSHQHPGTYALGDGDVVGYSFSEAGDCDVDQGDIWETGYFEVISIDNSSIRLRVVAEPHVPEIEVTAERC
jgi:hypothetical protein